ncbi:MAG: gliding motility-associated-like protein [Saprospiraceae bacterium]|jgi:gliding motility-associated-like protein|tara:strand:+ start:1033 stop:2901 length:1869 start_codon:yes stop_codon:yes gene_type:complete
MRITIFIFLISFYSFGQIYGQVAFEICDNGIDDDLDGFIDLNDEKCECANDLPSSLIPNPSFEDKTCCPSANAMLNCAVGWVQASAPTTDYINTCGGYLGNTSIPAIAPLPLADGEGAVGFRDGEEHVNSNYKEYVGACLTESMRAGVQYRLQFFVGFRDNVPGSKSLDIAIFGGTTCTQLPFGGGSISVGCPANTSTYDQIDIQFVSGSNEWVSVDFEFTPSKDYEVIVIGPSCQGNPNWIHSPYFYLDGLTLAETADFGLPFDNIEGSICNDDLIISIEATPGQTYQWYKDGVAIVGETKNSISLVSLPGAEGTYLVVVNVPGGCISSKVYNVRIPPYYADHATSICEGESYAIENSAWDQSGIYETTISAEDGCDSIVTVDLTVTPTTFSSLEQSFCEGDTFRYLDVVTNAEGFYTSTLVNANGCDSIVSFFLEEIPMTDGIEIEPIINVLLGDIINLQPETYDPELIIFSWTDIDNNILSTEPILEGLKPTASITYTITAEDKYGCDVKKDVMVRIDRSSVNIYTPNIFSPDENGVNDFFRFQSGNALVSVEQFVVFDRWGNLVYNNENIVDFENLKGWDGLYDGKEAEQGVYGWMIKAKFIDNTESVYRGDLTLVRL